MKRGVGTARDYAGAVGITRDGNAGVLRFLVRHHEKDFKMTLGLCFWILMLIWAVFGLAVWNGAVGPYGNIGHTLLLFVLLMLLGWHAFGPPLHG